MRDRAWSLRRMRRSGGRYRNLSDEDAMRVFAEEAERIRAEQRSENRA